MGKPSTKKAIVSVLKLPIGSIICSGCFSVGPGVDGAGMSNCCQEVVLTKESYLDAMHGRIPKIDLPNSQDSPSRPKRERPKRDFASGIRKGTMKYAAYELWGNGKSPQQIFESLTKQKMQPNMSSIRSWVGRFQHRYGNKDGQ